MFRISEHSRTIGGETHPRGHLNPTKAGKVYLLRHVASFNASPPPQQPVVGIKLVHLFKNLTPRHISDTMLVPPSWNMIIIQDIYSENRWTDVKNISDRMLLPVVLLAIFASASGLNLNLVMESAGQIIKSLSSLFRPDIVNITYINISYMTIIIIV